MRGQRGVVERVRSRFSLFLPSDPQSGPGLCCYSLLKYGIGIPIKALRFRCREDILSVRMPWGTLFAFSLLLHNDKLKSYRLATGR